MAAEPFYVSPLSDYDARLLSRRHDGYSVEFIQSIIQTIEDDLSKTSSNDFAGIYDNSLQLHYWKQVKEARERFSNG